MAELFLSDFEIDDIQALIRNGRNVAAALAELGIDMEPERAAIFLRQNGINTPGVSFDDIYERYHVAIYPVNAYGLEAKGRRWIPTI